MKHEDHVDARTSDAHRKLAESLATTHALAAYGTRCAVADQLAADVVAVGALRKRTNPGARSKSDMRYLRVAGANQIFLFFVSQKLPDHTPLRCGQHKLGNR